MQRIPMQDYEAAHRDFRWDVPATFNFATDVVDKWAADPEKPALTWCNADGDGERYTFADISRLSRQFANALAARGIAKGDTVIVMLPRIPVWQIVMVGCMRMGAVPVPGVTMLTANDLAYRVDHAAAKAVVTTAENTGKFDGFEGLIARFSVGGGPLPWVAFDAALAEQSDDFVAPEIADEDPAILYYTSGSTGKPKGVLHAARAIFAWRVSAWYWLDLHDDDTMWCSADTGWSKSGTLSLIHI